MRGAFHSAQPSCLLLLLLCLIRSCAAAWQTIGDYTDCGSVGFVTQNTLANFEGAEWGYWLNLSVIGQFSASVADASPITDRASTLLLAAPKHANGVSSNTDYTG